MKSFLYILLFTSLFLVRGCEREIWEKNLDLTLTLEENENIEETRVFNDYAEAPLRIIFKDEDDGYFYFSENPEEIPFKFYEEGNNIYRVTIDNYEEKVIEVIQKEEEMVIVRFAWGSTWIIYTMN